MPFLVFVFPSTSILRPIGPLSSSQTSLYPNLYRFPYSK